MFYLAPSLAGGLGSSAMDYLGGFQYQDNVLKHFPTAEGYVSHVSGSYQYIYNYTDHLGNIRLSYGWDMAEGKLKIMEENHYYPFGMKHANYNTHTLSAMKKEEGNEMTLKAAAAPSTPKPVMGYNYKYNGKEFQDELGLNLYDYGARNYDPAIGRWMNIDPLAEMSRKYSPYAYALDNPVYFIDPDGMLATPGPDDWVGKKVGENSYQPVWQENVTSADDKDLAKGDHYIGKSAVVAGTDGKNYQLNADRTANIADPSAALTPVGQSASEASTPATEIDAGTIGNVSDGIGLTMDTQEAVLGMAEELGTSGNKLLDITKKIGKATGIVSAIGAWYEYSENQTTGGLVKALANTGLAFARVNPAAGIVIGILDLTGVSDIIYQGAGTIIDNQLKL